MIKYLLAAAMVVCCSTAALAEGGKDTSKPYRGQRGVKSGDAAAKQQDWWKRDQAIMDEDPYWDRCLSYSRSWGPGACGR